MSDFTSDETGAEHDAHESAGRIVLSTGVVVHAKAVPDEVIMRLQRKVRLPKVPLWHNPDKDRDEPNANDPDYQEALRDYQVQLALASSNALLLYGTELVSIPDGFPGPEDPEWIEELELTSMSSGSGKRARFYDWLTLKAGPTRDDRTRLMFAIGRATGTIEQDVQEAYKSAGG